MKQAGQFSGAVALAIVIAAAGLAAAAPAPSESARMLRAKDLMSEDQWAAAIPVLRAAIADPKEQNREEALFWLAHSQNQAGDLAEAVESIRRLQREHPKSRWSAPAYSLLMELAHKLGRHDVLWWTATPPPAPAVAPVPPPVRVRPVAPRVRGARPVPPALPAPPEPATTPVPVAGPAAPPPPPPAPVAWVSDNYHPDVDLRVQALGRLINTDAEKVIPILRDIALERKNPAAARRAVFVLAQSRNPRAQLMVVDVAKRGADPVRLAAVRELGRFGGADVSRELLEVYASANVPVKQQVVVSLGERADAPALLKIAQSETDARLRNTAIVTLGRAGGRDELRILYAKVSPDTRRAVVGGLFNARDEDGLIRILERERDPGVRAEVLARLILMGTPRAKAVVEKNK